MKFNWYLLVLAMVFSACAADITYHTTALLSGERFTGRDGSLHGSIPKGWFSSTEDTLAPLLLVWLLNEDYSASISIKELQLNEIAARRVRDAGLAMLARLSYAGRRSATTTDGLQLTEFELGSRRLCAYETTSPEGRARVVVFAIGGRYFESEATPTKGLWTEDALRKIFTDQQTILSSLSNE